MRTPPALVLGCNTPHGLGVLSDWIQEQTGITPDFGSTNWSDGYATDTGAGFGHDLAGGSGCGYGFSDGSGDGNGYGYGDIYPPADGNGYGFNYGIITGNGYGCPLGFN